MRTQTPQLPPPEARIRVLIDTDFACEIDDIYALALAVCSADRFDIAGINAAHFAQTTGRVSIDRSYNLLLEFLEVAGWKDRVPVVRGSDPLAYLDEGVPSKGVDQIIELARAASPEHPLWIVSLGAFSTPASALLLAPDIIPNIRIVAHARSEMTWPETNDQFNVWGDIRAARALLDSAVPLVWFDTGTSLTCTMETTAARLAPTGALGAYLHAYRDRNNYFRNPQKGFFDVADIAWMIDRTLCTEEVVPAPALLMNMHFDHKRPNGEIVHVTNICAEPTWELFFDRLAHPRSVATEK